MFATQSNHIHLDFCMKETLYKGWTGLPLYSSHWRIYYHKEAGAGVLFDGQEIMFSPGKLYCIPPATACKGIRLKGVEQLYLHFQVGSPFLKNKPGVYELNTHSALRKSLEQLWQGELSFSPSPKSTLLCTQVISHSLVTIYDQVLHENEIDARIMSSINAMRFKLSQKLSIDTLAKKQGLAPTSYIRLFKKEVGVSPHQFIIQLRIEKAKLLLQSTAMSIEDIAENTGFVDRFHFSKVFLQNAGKTPVAFRK